MAYDPVFELHLRPPSLGGATGCSLPSYRCLVSCHISGHGSAPLTLDPSLSLSGQPRSHRKSRRRGRAPRVEEDEPEGLSHQHQTGANILSTNPH